MVDGFTQDEVDGLLGFGLFTEAFTYQDMTMRELTDFFVHASAANASSVDLAEVLRIVGFRPDSTDESLRDLKSLLSQLDPTTLYGVFTWSTYHYVWLVSLATVAIILRFHSKGFMPRNIRLDDWISLVAIISTIGFTIALVFADLYGYGGEHVYNISYRNLQTFFRYVAIIQPLYLWAIYLVKNIFLAFYYSLTPNLIFRRSVLGVFVLNTVTTLVFVLLLIFQCKGLRWWKKPLTANCINRTSLFLGASSVGTVVDFLIFLLPIPVVLRMQLNLKEKLLVVGMFALGLLCCVARIMSAKTLNDFVRAVDVSAHSSLPAIWMSVEINLGIIVTSMPALKSLFTTLGGRLMGRSSKSSTPKSPDDSDVSDSRTIRERMRRKRPNQNSSAAFQSNNNVGVDDHREADDNRRNEEMEIELRDV